MICKVFGHKWTIEYTAQGTAMRHCVRCGLIQVRKDHLWRPYMVTKGGAK